MKVGLDKKTIIEAAANMADERGIANVTLKVLATELGVKSPSLYKHFSGGLDELNKELMLYGWRLLEADITRAAIGKSKDNAVRAICLAYREFVAKHKGVFEAMQWYNIPNFIAIAFPHTAIESATMQSGFSRFISSHTLSSRAKVVSTKIFVENARSLPTRTESLGVSFCSIS